MTDGTTGIPVAPITEDEAMKFSSIFRAMADAVVNQSSLKAQVEQLQHDLNVTMSQRDEVQHRYNALIDELGDVRSRLQASQHDFSVSQDRVRQLEAEANDHAQTEATLRGQIESLNTQLVDVKRDRDDRAFTSMDLEDKLKTSQEKLKAIHVALGLTPQAMQAPADAPAPQPEPTPPAQEPHPVQATAEPEPLATPPTPSERDDWAPGYYWDNDKQKYISG